MPIKSNIYYIDSIVKISDDADIIATDEIYIGRYAVINKGFKARCRKLFIGDHVFIGENVEIGGGGCFGLESEVAIFRHSLIAQDSFINCAAPVHIGRHVAFGYGVQIWTHGVWQSPMMGYGKQKQEPVFIGDDVWIPSRCQILPGVTIGDNVVVGMGSLVNKSLPSGCMAAGVPCKVIKENAYPNPISDEELLAELQRLCDEYISIAEDKGFTPFVGCSVEDGIAFYYQEEIVNFNIKENRIYSDSILSKYAEDFRDYLRRNGFPFYDGGFFESLPPFGMHEMGEYDNHSDTSWTASGI